MLRTCERCGLMFLPARSTDRRCGVCARPQPILGRRPIDLWEEWADDPR